MSYTLLPMVVDIPKLRALMGSKDTRLLQAVIEESRDQLIGIDELGEYFEEFEDEIQAEYNAFIAGDFSSVDLHATYPERPKQDDLEEEELTELREDLSKIDISDPAAMLELMQKHVKLTENILGDMNDDEGDDGDEEDDEEAIREVTTGAALVQMIMGGNQDGSQGYKYGYALLSLCDHIGEPQFNDTWCSIRYASLEAVDALLVKLGVEPKTFTTSAVLVGRGAPVTIPTADDFPFIGYLERTEIPPLLAKLDPKKVDAALANEDPDVEEWLRPAVDELRNWLETCVKTERDLVCFYC
jgi:hypothetical protein